MSDAPEVVLKLSSDEALVLFECRGWARQVSADAEEVAVTAAEKIRAEERAKALAGQQSLLLKLLSSLFGKVPPHVEQRVRNASTDEIEQWTLAAPKAKGLSDVFA